MIDKKRLFRALPASLGDWVYGSVVDNGKDRCYIVQNHINQRIPVIRETVGQYVPCLDAYEGDILFGTDRDPESPRPIWYGTVTYMPEQSRLMIVDDIGDLYEVDDFQFERILGNIHQYKRIFREQLISHHLVKSILGNIDAIVSHETAALLLDLSVPTYQSTIHIYSTADCNIPGVTAHIVESLEDIPHINVMGMRITTPEQTLRDLLLESNDSEILFSSLSNYQTRNPDNFQQFIDGLSADHLEVYNSIEVDVFDYLDAE